LAAVTVAAAGIGVPAAAHAQVTAYAVIPSWTQSKVLVKDAHTGAAVASIPLTGEPYDAAITADGRRAYVTLRASNEVAIIDLGTLQVDTTIAVGLEPRGVAIDGTRAWITEAGSHTVSAIDLSTNAVIGAPIPVGAMPWGIALRPQGDRLYVVNRASSTVSAIDLVTQMVVAVMPVDQEPVEIIIAPDGLVAYVTSTIADTVVPIDLNTHTVLPSIPVGLFPRDLAITPDGKQIFVANSDSGTVSVIETSTQSVINTIVLGANSIPSGVSITPEGRQVLVGTQTQTLRIIDANTHAQLATIPVGGQALRLTTTASLIVPDPQGNPLSITQDADLSPLGFGNYITFRGGVLRAKNDIFTFRHVSLLTQGGTIDTQHFTVQIAGETVNDGTLVKRGTGTLTLSGNGMHKNTDVPQGTLSVLGTHNGSVRLGTAGTLAGTGTVVSVNASYGAISPGTNAPGDLYAGNVQMSPSHTLIIEINGVTPGLQYDRLIANSVSLKGATLMLVPGAFMPKGSAFTIVTNANGTFAGLPEGALISTIFGKFRISYMGGPTQTDVVLRAL
jgi:YVTN family beta-propeller protein/autotransporter-associated beta strand protein